MNALELARKSDAQTCYEIIEQAKAFQREQGFVQWTDDYPNLQTILDDIDDGNGYALKVDGSIAGYLCVSFDGESDYSEIRGKWSSDARYAVVHRMAFDQRFRGKGLAGVTLALVEKLCEERAVRCIRIDTDSCNERMQHILLKSGFVKCGTIMFQGSEKLAFDKVF